MLCAQVPRQGVFYFFIYFISHFIMFFTAHKGFLYCNNYVCLSMYQVRIGSGSGVSTHHVLLFFFIISHFQQLGSQLQIAILRRGNDAVGGGETALFVASYLPILHAIYKCVYIQTGENYFIYFPLFFFHH